MTILDLVPPDKMSELNTDNQNEVNRSIVRKTCH